LLTPQLGGAGFGSLGALAGFNHGGIIRRVTNAHEAGAIGFGAGAIGFGLFGGQLAFMGDALGVSLILGVSDRGSGKRPDGASDEGSSEAEAVLAADGASDGRAAKASDGGILFGVGSHALAAGEQRGESG
jgi:hypothetical protein